jgi:D-threonate/D-erythronate kinase
MIAIIADDLSGAAEMAGICLRFGLTVQLCTENIGATTADMLIVSTDSRSMSALDAIAITESVCRKVLSLQPTFIYKKVDSVLRGYVVEELQVQMKLMGKKAALLLPANPSLGRTIQQGLYYIEGKPVHTTSFANDPEFPIRDASIPTMCNDASIKVLKHTDALLDEGIAVGEVSTEPDLIFWASKSLEKYVVAGAGDFFNAILQLRYSQKEHTAFSFQLPFLYVCGTTYKRSLEEVQAITKGKNVVAYLEIQPNMEAVSINKNWLQRCSEILQAEQKLVIAFDQATIPPHISAVFLRNYMATAVKEIVENNPIKEMLVEGGSTANAILRALNMDAIHPINEVMRGVVRMQSNQLYITVKPGSYILPTPLKELFFS